MTTRPRATDTNSADETIRDSLLVLLQLPLSSMGNKQAAELTSKLKKVLLAAKRKSATADQLGLMLHLLNSDHAPLNRLFCSADIHQVPGQRNWSDCLSIHPNLAATREALQKLLGREISVREYPS